MILGPNAPRPWSELEEMVGVPCRGSPGRDGDRGMMGVFGGQNPGLVEPSLKLTAIFAPENGWLEYEFPFRMAYFQVQAVSFKGV